MKNSEANFRNLKFILFCYEAMSGMKINYSKSEICTLGLEKADQEKIASFFGCKMGVFPIMYLGMPVSDHKISKSQ